jgi:hypothetical protein
MAGLTAVAGIVVLMYAIHLARGTGVADDVADDAAHEAHRLRERRGF